jgi:hypothetical protein
MTASSASSEMWAAARPLRTADSWPENRIPDADTQPSVHAAHGERTHCPSKGRAGASGRRRGQTTGETSWL